MPNRPDPRGSPQQPPDGEPQQRGVGSGFILNADGYVMTNAHVVEGADEVIVTLADKREFKAKIDRRRQAHRRRAGQDRGERPADRAHRRRRRKLKVGEWVIAIGSPFGLESTVTAGIVSAKSRDTGDLLPLIQTDVAINPGNSGGPLINMRGEVVGINSQIYSRSGGYMGISFAIPIDEATRVVGAAARRRPRDPRPHRRRHRPGDARSRRVDRPRQADRRAGAAASRRAARPRRPASRPGDIITKVDGRAVETLGRAAAHRRQHQAGHQGDAAGVPARQHARPQRGRRRVRGRARRRAARRPSATAPSRRRPSAARPGGGRPDRRAEARAARSRTASGSRRVEGAAARAGMREGDVILTSTTSR